MPIIPKCNRHVGGANHGIFGARGPTVPITDLQRPAFSQFAKSRAIPHDMLDRAVFVETILTMGRSFNAHMTKSMRGSTRVRKQTDNGVTIG